MGRRARPTPAKAGSAQWNLVRSRLRSGEANAALTSLHDLLARHAGWLGRQAPDLRDGAERMERGDLAGAEAAFERMIARQPDSELVPLAYALRRAECTGRTATRWGWYGRSCACSGPYTDTVPAYARLAHYLGRYADGDAGVADDFGALAESGDEGFRDIYQYMAARTLLEQGRFEATRDALEKLRRDHPDGDFTGIVDLEHAWNLFRDGRHADALAIFQRLDARRPRPERPTSTRSSICAPSCPWASRAAWRRSGGWTRQHRRSSARSRSTRRACTPSRTGSARDRVRALGTTRATLPVIEAHPDEPKVGASPAAGAGGGGSHARLAGGLGEGSGF